MAQNSHKISTSSEQDLNISKTEPNKGQDDKSMTLKPKFHYLKKIFMPWRWKKKKKSEKFKAISTVLERKMSTRISKDQLIEMGLIPPSHYSGGADQSASGAKKENPCFDDGNSSRLESASMFVGNVNESYNEREVDRSWVSEVGVIPPPEMFSPASKERDPRLTSLVSVMAVGEGLDLSDPDIGEKLLKFGDNDCDINENAVDCVEAVNEHVATIESTKLSKQPKLVNVVQQAMQKSDNKLVLEVNSPCDRVNVKDEPNENETESPEEPHNSSVKRKVARAEAEVTNTPSLRPPLKEKPSNVSSPLSREEWQERKERIGRSLERRLSTRPSAEELRERNLIPKLSNQEKEDIKRRISIKLERRLSIRPTETDLKNRNILRHESSEESNQKKEETKNILQRKLSIRPSVAELKRRKILNFSEYIEVFIFSYYVSSDIEICVFAPGC